MQIFARLTKVNEADRTIEGVIASEAVDRSGEIFDYTKSKPNFVRWSAELGKATEGKNIGNVRAMHGNVSAGITKSMDFDDAAKQIVVKAEITDDNEWRKVMKGNYTGLSIGGRYAEKWKDETLGKTRYAADPSEYSLVDLPCNPEATFTVVKAAGGEELHKFDVVSVDTDALAKTIDSLSDDLRGALLSKIARRKAVEPKEGEDKYGDDADFADAKNKKYPLDTASHIRAAWAYIHMPKNAAKYDAEDVKTIKGRIASAWRKKVNEKGPPSAEKFLAFVEPLMKREDAILYAGNALALIGAEPIEKGLWAVAQFAGVLEQLCALADGTVYETEAEGDESPLPGVMRAALKPIAAAFLQMAAEETNEALHGELNDDAALELAAAAGDLAKVGRKHTKTTRAHRKALRDHMQAMNGTLDAMDADDPMTGTADADDKSAEKIAKAAGDLVKVTAERDGLQKQADTLRQQLADTMTRIAAPRGSARVVEKALPGTPPPPPEDTAPVLKSDGTPDVQATAVKLAKVAYANPIPFYR